MRSQKVGLDWATFTFTFFQEVSYLRFQLNICRMAHKTWESVPEDRPLPVQYSWTKVRAHGLANVLGAEGTSPDFLPSWAQTVDQNWPGSFTLSSVIWFFKVNFNIFYLARFCFVRRRPGPTWPETRRPWNLFKAEPSPTAHSAPDYLNRNRMLAAAVRATLPCQGELPAAWLGQAPSFLWIPRWKWRPRLGHIHGETAESLRPSHLGGPHLTSVGLGRLLLQAHGGENTADARNA